jgi:OOP family OmpA-OmpF porin
MTRSFTKQTTGLAAAVAMALAIISGTANATDAARDSAYATDSRGNVPMSAYGLCWHSGFGPAPISTAECDPNFRPAVQPVAQLVEPAPAPIPVTVAAVPVAPTAAPPAPMPVAQKVTIEADTLFDFDKAVLRPAGRAALDAFVAKMKGIDPEVIMALGHADRLGSDKYNQRLSEERVGAVKDYLISLGIAPNRMHTEGKGEAQPVTRADECVGGKSAKLIACLQPDRRVEIEVIGTRTAQ